MIRWTQATKARASPVQRRLGTLLPSCQPHPAHRPRRQRDTTERRAGRQRRNLQVCQLDGCGFRSFRPLLSTRGFLNVHAPYLISIALRPIHPCPSLCILLGLVSTYSFQVLAPSSYLPAHRLLAVPGVADLLSLSLITRRVRLFAQSQLLGHITATLAHMQGQGTSSASIIAPLSTTSLFTSYHRYLSPVTLHLITFDTSTKGRLARIRATGHVPCRDSPPRRRGQGFLARGRSNPSSYTLPVIGQDRY